MRTYDELVPWTESCVCLYVREAYSYIATVQPTTVWPDPPLSETPACRHASTPSWHLLLIPPPWSRGTRAPTPNSGTPRSRRRGTHGPGCVARNRRGSPGEANPELVGPPPTPPQNRRRGPGPRTGPRAADGRGAARSRAGTAARRRSRGGLRGLACRGVAQGKGRKVEVGERVSSSCPGPG